MYIDEILRIQVCVAWSRCPFVKSGRLPPPICDNLQMKHLRIMQRLWESFVEPKRGKIKRKHQLNIKIYNDISKIIKLLSRLHQKNTTSQMTHRVQEI